MKATQIRELSRDEIATRISELERERFNLRFRSGTAPLEDPLRLRVIRRELARLKTVQHETKPGAGGSTAPASSATKGGK